MKSSNCCKIEALLTIDERGQIVIPKEIRDNLALRGGDKLALMTWEKNGKTCCISLFKADELTTSVKDILGPVVDDVFKK